ncbi:MAG: hypothetical protein HY236_12680 [Acidobacteria bacterium]|nr:hypothetical protein [Acidobacteriota bacterium]
MKTTNLFVAILYTLVVAALFVISLTPRVMQTNSYQPYPRRPLPPVAIVFLGVPTVLNWMSFAAWNNERSKVKTATLVIAVIYAILIATMLVTALTLGREGLLLGSLISAVPVVSNWLSYFYWPAATTNDTL